MSEKRSTNRRLRKQPAVRRMQVAMPASPPKLAIPRTAKKRRRRNNPTFQRPLALLKQFVVTSRWISLGILLICAAALYLVSGDQTFTLTAIPVEGAQAIPPQEIAAASGLAGVHIFAADPDRAARQVAALPGVISATVSLEWPNQVLIQVREDTPVAVWVQEGQSYWINRQGTLIPERASVPGLLQIQAEGDASLITLSPDPAGEDTAETETNEAGAPTPEAAMTAALRFVPAEVLRGALLLRQLRPNIESLYYDPRGGLSYQDGRGWRAYFGVGEDMAQKLTVYETLVDRLLAEGRAPQYISVSNPRKPFFLATGGGDQ